MRSVRRLGRYFGEISDFIVDFYLIALAYGAALAESAIPHGKPVKVVDFNRRSPQNVVIYPCDPTVIDGSYGVADISGIIRAVMGSPIPHCL